jgi:UDPglucose 6-dehydrogenase
MGSCRVTVVGAGYVGLTSATCLARLGHRVVCVDNDTAKVASLCEGRVPFYEPDLDKLLREGLASERLRVTTALPDAVRDADLVLLCVPTPMGDDGGADLGAVRTVLAKMRTSLPSGCVVVTKSTVPVGTSHRIRELLRRPDVSVASNPEFLREGTAVRDFFSPDRIVIGVDDPHARDRLSELYEAIPAPRVWTDPVSAELTKYAANAMLALRVSYANVLAELCEKVGADIRDVIEAMGYDERIGPAFLRPGPGWGGSCLPKDAHELVRAAASVGVDAGMVREALAINDRQARRVVARTRRLATGSADGSLRGVRVGLLGLAFKAGTDDLRDSPAVTVARLLAQHGAELTAYDPGVRAERADVVPAVVVDDPYRVAKGASVLVVLTEWPEFQHLDWGRLADLMVRPVVLDTRNHLPADDLRAAGLEWHGLGIG